MSYEFAKIALWVLLCIPIVIIAFYLVFNILGDNKKIRDRRKAREAAIRNAKLERRDSIRRRRRFEEEYERMRGGYDDE